MGSSKAAKEFNQLYSLEYSIIAYTVYNLDSTYINSSPLLK